MSRVLGTLIAGGRSGRDSCQVVGSTGLFRPPDEGILEIGHGVVASRRGRVCT